MKILVLGGTRFIGRHLVAECLDRGDEVTVLHRGRSPSPFAGRARHVIADRRAPTPQARRVLAEPWDAVVDTNARDIADLRPALFLLGDIGRYLMLSTCGVYRRVPGRALMLTEGSPTVAGAIPTAGYTSAIRKLRCEQYLRRRLDRAGTPWLIARLGLVIGPLDHSQRLAYWLERVLRGGDVLVPMDHDQPLQLLDAYDLSRFLLVSLDKALSGVVNVAGPATTAAELIDTVIRHAGRDAAPCWVGEQFALSHGVRPWTEVPLWLPATSPERALMAVSSATAEGAGLSYRPLGDTITDCLSWHAARRDWSRQWLDPDRERHLIKEWRK